MLEFTALRHIVDAYNKGELKDGDHYIHKGVELVLVNVNGKTINCHDVGAPPFKGSEASKAVAEILMKGALKDMQ